MAICHLQPIFRVIMRCVDPCPPGAGDICTLQFRVKAPPGVPPNPWRDAEGGAFGVGMKSIVASA